MSGFSSQGVGLAASANADVVSAISAAAVKRVLVENLVILLAPSNRSEKVGPAMAVRRFLNKSRTSIARQHHGPVHRSARRSRLWDLPRPASRLCSGLGLEQHFAKDVIGMIPVSYTHLTLPTN